MSWTSVFPPLALAAAVLVGTAVGTHAVQASDHDDGTNDYKTLNTNLTDLYVFKETSHRQDGGGVADDVVLVMNVNPRALPQQQYFFNTAAQYDFNVRRIPAAEDLGAAIDAAAPVADMVLRCTFDAPDDAGQQAMRVATYYQAGTRTLDSTVVTSGQRQYVDGTPLATPTGDLVTTPHGFGPEDAGVAAAGPDDANGVGRHDYDNESAIKNVFTVDGHAVTAFAGLREDPFFFDVEQYFKVRSGAATQDYVTFTDDASKKDFTDGYNVLSIVLKVPRALLAAPDKGVAGTATRFDVWETVRARI